MIKDLITLANKLDTSGFISIATKIDNIIKKIASDDDDFQEQHNIFMAEEERLGELNNGVDIVFEDSELKRIFQKQLENFYLQDEADFDDNLEVFQDFYQPDLNKPEVISWELGRWDGTDEENSDSPYSWKVLYNFQNDERVASFDAWLVPKGYIPGSEVEGTDILGNTYYFYGEF